MISVTEFRRSYFWSDISLTPHWLEALANLWGCWSCSLYLRDQCWRGLQLNVCAKRMLHPSTKSTWTCRTVGFLGLVSCSRSGRYAYHQTGDGVVARRKSQWNKYSQNPRPGSRLTGGTCCCNNQRWGNVSIVGSARTIMSECEQILWHRCWYYRLAQQYSLVLHTPCSVDFGPNASRYVDVSYVKRLPFIFSTGRIRHSTCVPWRRYPILFPTVCTWILGLFQY